MKLLSSLLMVLVVVLITTTSTFAQYNVVKLDAFGFLNKRINIAFERSFFKQASIGVAYEGATYATTINTGGGGSSADVYDLSYKGFISEFRYYPFHKRKTAPLGFYAGPSFRYSAIKEFYYPNNIELDGRVFNYGLITGYKFSYEILIAEFLIGYGGGTINREFMDANRSSYADFFDDDYLVNIKRNVRFEISVGAVFPKIKTKTSGKY